MDNYRSFPIWKIDSPRLLQKYEAYEQNGRLLHRAVCTVWHPLAVIRCQWLRSFSKSDKSRSI